MKLRWRFNFRLLNLLLLCGIIIYTCRLHFLVSSQNRTRAEKVQHVWLQRNDRNHEWPTSNRSAHNNTHSDFNTPRQISEEVRYITEKWNPREVKLDPSEVDIVTSSGKDLDFLNEWQEFFQGFHIIIIQVSDSDEVLWVPEWLDYELHKRRDIERTLGKDALIFHSDASLVSVGYLISTKPFVYAIENNCLPVVDSGGYYINPLAIHIRNLKTPATPFYFTMNDIVGSSNAARDPYALRSSAATAISHGLWIDEPDNKDTSDKRFFDTTITIPHGTPYSMFSVNVAIAREGIGPAFMLGLMQSSKLRFDCSDLFTGWASKLVADHLRLGIKSGQPYIWHDSCSSKSTESLNNTHRETWSQDELLSFMSKVKLPFDATTAATAYSALASEIRRDLKPRNHNFEELASKMETWVELWQKSENGTLFFHPSHTHQSLAKPINLGERSRKYSIRTNITLHFGRLATANVTKQDRQLGASWKTYVYPLPSKFHLEALERFDKGCIMQPCTDSQLQTLSKNFPLGQYTDHEAEIVILAKLLSSLDIVYDPDKADLFLVPALSVTVVNSRGRRCRNFGQCKDRWYRELFQQLPFLKDPTRPHLFLATQDWNQNHPSIAEKLHHKKNALVANLGPGGIVVPSLNTNANLQPSLFPKSLSEEALKKTFIMANFGIRHKDRIVIAKQLQNYTGTRRIVKPQDAWDADDMFGAVFTLCLPGDLPFQKRFFDAILYMSIPVVIQRQTTSKENNETFTSFWDSRTSVQYTSTITNHSVAASYPDIGFLGISYDDFVVSLSVEEAHADIVGALERIYSDKVEMERRRNALKRVRQFFLYDLEGSAPDAFTATLYKLHTVLKPNAPPPVSLIGS